MKHIDGKLTVTGIKKCDIIKYENGKYRISCRIGNFGTRNYTYEKGNPGIVKDGGVYYLSDEAFCTINQTVNDFESKADYIKSGRAGYTVFNWNDKGVTFYYNKLADGKYNTFTEYANDIGSGCFCHNQVAVGDLLGSLVDNVIPHINITCMPEELDANPLYLSAKQNGDENLIESLRIQYGNFDAGFAEGYYKKYGVYILPSVSEEFCRDYAIDARTFSSKALKALKTSGYSVLHRPYFAMYKSTHDCFTVNPYKRYIVDAAKSDLQVMSFSEWLDSVYPDFSKKYFF